MPPEITVGVCCLNGERTIARTIAAVRAQTIAPAIELIVVDDGSDDDTAYIAEQAGARVIRHADNRGPAAGRNSIARAAGAPIVLYIDDECVAERDWAERHLRLYDDPRVLGTGGPLVAAEGPGWIRAYLARNSPAGFLEAEVGHRDGLGWRLAQYVRRSWTRPSGPEPRAAYAVAGGNMGFRREVILAIGGFDERYAFGPEDYDLCLRVRDALPDGLLMADPAAVVTHEYSARLSDALRRDVAYGRNGAALYRRRPRMRLAPLPLPFLVLGLLLLSRRRSLALALAALLPHAVHPRGLRDALTGGPLAGVSDAYVTLAREAATNIGYLDVVIAGERPRDAAAPAADPAALAAIASSLTRAPQAVAA